LSAGPTSNLYYNFFQLLMAGVLDVKVPNPGPYTTPPLDLDINPLNYLSPFELLTDYFPNTTCTIVLCSP
jgi:hypothetical protein